MLFLKNESPFFNLKLLSNSQALLFENVIQIMKIFQAFRAQGQSFSRCFAQMNTAHIIPPIPGTKGKEAALMYKIIQSAKKHNENMVTCA